MNFEEFKEEISKIIYEEGLIDYLIKYHDSLEKIKILLEKSSSSLEQFKEKLNSLKIETKKDDTKFKIPDFLIDKITAALYLRYIIEIVISMFVGNNKNCLKDNVKINTGRIAKVIDVLYENDDIDVGIFKGIKKVDYVDLYIHKFWTKEKLKDNYDFLSKQIHRFHELNDDWISSKYSSVLNLIDIDYETNNEIFNRLKSIYSTMYHTLYNHMISVENDKVIIEIKNMQIFTFYPDKILKFNKN